jgi:hypothetical protein
MSELKALKGLELGPHNLSIIGKNIAEMVIDTTPDGEIPSEWIKKNIEIIDSVIFDNFNNSNLVHALQFAKLELRG